MASDDQKSVEGMERFGPRTNTNAEQRNLTVAPVA